MVTLIKCSRRVSPVWTLVLVVLTATGRIGGGGGSVECIKNDGGAEHHHQQQDVAAGVDAIAVDDAESVGRSEGRQAKGLSFFPTEKPNNYLQYDFQDSPDYQSKSYDEPTFKFSNDVRQNYVESNYDQRPQSFNSGEYNPGNSQTSVSVANGPSAPSIIYGQYQSNNDQRPRPPPAGPGYYGGPYYGNPSLSPPRPQPPSFSNNYAGNYNYINNDHKPHPPLQPQYPNRPPLGRPPQPAPAPYNPGTYRPTHNQQTHQQPQQQQSNYAGNYNVYQPQPQTPSGTLSITDFISNLGQSASDLFYGGRQQPHPQYPQYASNAPGSAAAPGVPANPVGQFANAIEAVTKHDDLQCIPKIICQMVGKQRRQNSESALLGSPVFSSLISAVPSSSVGLVYGRAALLGYTAGENRCDGAYPKCPRSEDNLLYYLNNHRGGFFRFFNGGAAYGDIGGSQPPIQNNQHNYQRPQGQYNPQQEHYIQQQYQQQSQYQPPAQQTFQQQQESTNTNLAFLTGLADAINQSGGINLSNLGANAGVLGNIASIVRGMAASGAPSGFNVGDMFSNLLTGFVGDRFTNRRISKRSVDEVQGITEPTTSTELDPLVAMEKEMQFVKKTDSKKRNLDAEMQAVPDMKVGVEPAKDEMLVVLVEDEKEEIFAEDEDEDILSPSNSTTTNEEDLVESRIVNDGSFDLPEGRILNIKRPTYSSYKQNIVNFPTANTIRDDRKVKFMDMDSFQSIDSRPRDVFIFQSNLAPSNKPYINEILRFPDETSFTNRGSKRIKFEHKEAPERAYYDIPLDRIKMVFPDRTGTGNLRFDNNDFETRPVRFGRILSGARPQTVNNYNIDNSYYNNRDSENLGNYQQNNYNRNDNDDSAHRQELYNRYQSSTNTYNSNHQSADNGQRYRPTNSGTSSSSNYNNNAGSSSSPSSGNGNVYVTNAKGVVEYYINPAGNKVYI